MENLFQHILAAAGSPWVPLLIAVVSCVDGFFPPIPSESVVVALASVGASTGSPHLLALAIAAAVGAIAGDNIAFWLGRRLGTRRFGWMRRPRVTAVFDFAAGALDHRSALLILTARYIPVGRVAVNMTAGATGFAWSRFLPLSVLAGATWAGYSIAIGTIFGQWVHVHPILGAVLAVVVAMLLGFLLDLVIGRITGRPTPNTDRRDPAAASGSGSEVAEAATGDSH